MGAIGVHHTATSEGAWDGPANEARLRADGSAAYYRSAFAWQDPEGDPATKAAYRFIHHEVGGDGRVGAANLRGASTGIGVLNGGRGGTTIPSGDVAGVYRHLAAHLRDGDREPPELDWKLEFGGWRLEGIERRTGPSGQLEVRELAGQPIRLVGYAAVFNQESDDLGGFRELIEPGAFAESLGGDVRALWNHNPEYVLGRTTNGSLRLMEDVFGLRVEVEPPDTQWARDGMVSIRRGDVSQMSFGFLVTPPDGDMWVSEGERILRRLRRVELLDVSPVTFPAYPQTTVTVRSMAAGLRARAVETDESAWRRALARRRMRIMSDE